MPDEADHPGAAVRPETGKMGDDLVPIIGGFPFLSEEDKTKIFNTNPLAVCPAFANVKGAAAGAKA